MTSVITSLVLASVLSIVAVYDLYVALTTGYQGTVSAVVLQVSTTYPVVPLMVGVLLGHLFWPQIPLPTPGPIAPPSGP